MAYRGEENRSIATDWPVPGRYYVVGGIKPGEGLSHMAAAAYGDGKRWREIWNANKGIARKYKNPDSGEWELNPNRAFWPKDVIWIPGEYIEEVEEAREEIVESLPGEDANGIVLVIDGERVVPSTCTVSRWFDTAADGFAAVVPWNPESEKQRRLYRPYGYQQAECYVGGRLQVRGRLYNVAPSFGDAGREISLEGWSYTACAVDVVVGAPLERAKITLEARARELCEPLGIGVEWAAGDHGREPFDRATATQDQRILDHLAELAKQRTVQISCTTQGRLLFHRAPTADMAGDPGFAPVAVLVEGYPPLMSGSTTYSGRDRFASYTARAQTPGRRGKPATSQAVAEDPAVPSHRRTSSQSQDAEGVQDAANWERSKALEGSMTLDIPVNSWYTDPARSTLWQTGQIVTVVSDSLCLHSGFNFLIKAVEFSLTADGASGKITLTPPQIYTGEPLPDPWHEPPAGEGESDV